MPIIGPASYEEAMARIDSIIVQVEQAVEKLKKEFRSSSVI